ncbi:GNAT family N-acetyltransferase [Actinophytocola sp.]|uniref:GNAT family N-acetyltransferase n=1 Tax=Actinophytocola sp. TaxID=1872138 RepID=UPI002D800FEB|nr:GNAT family N-acetyltransferase [Actinophytocola sp.]HET9138898.1 GNAT family N-acetyltransferase [Actinophytocola sp.]
MPAAFLETERLVLRRFTEADVDDLADLNSDPAVLRFLTGGRPVPRAEVRGGLLPRILADYERVAGRGTWVAEERSTGGFLGWVELRAPERGTAAEAELGYRLRASAWGRGYATEAARALVDKAFTETQLHRVWAETMAVNKASRRVLEKVGLRFVRTFWVDWTDPIDGAEHGEVEYEMVRDDWLRTDGNGGHGA